MITFADGFAGIGGFHLGLKQAGGFECVWANDVDKYAAKTYQKNFPETPFITGDIRDIDADSLPDFDLWCSGFPCQSFSVAGKRRGLEEARGTLFYEIARIAECKRPRLLLLENVKGLLSHDEGRTFATILRVMGSIGYRLEWQVFNSKWFGVPQNRERVFIIGHLGENPSRTVFPITEIGGLPDEAGNSPVVRTLTGGGHSGGLHSQMTMIYDAYNHSPRPEIGAVKTNEVLPTSSSNLLVQPVLTPDRPEKRQNGRRFKEPGEEMFTLTGQDIHGIAYPETSNTLCDGWLMDTKHHSAPMNQYRIRRLTPLECERLQGFPDGWTEGVSDTQRYKQLGNAVTVNVIRFLGQSILASEKYCSDTGSRNPTVSGNKE
jgi:DNA (cytosine-5)-methyltransferase 1